MKSKIRYRTERTRELRLKELSTYESGLLDTVEEFGCMVLSVQNPGGDRPIFSYTIGLYDTRQVPEIICCGLPSSTAHSALNYAAKLAADGVDLTDGRQSNVIGNVDVEFRPVDSKWSEF